MRKMAEISFAILTISDRSFAQLRPDLSGPALVKEISEFGGKIIETRIVPDEITQISETLIYWSDVLGVNVILTTGGTGFAPRDVTPEATIAILDKQAPGIIQAILESSLKITPHAMLSRPMAGIRKKSLIVNFPGNPKAAVENFRVIKFVLPHAIDLIHDLPDAESGHAHTNHHSG